MKKGHLKKKQIDEEKDSEEWEEVDDHEKDVFDKDGYFDVPESQGQISATDEKLLKILQRKREETGKAQPKQAENINLSDLIMMKLQTGQFQDGGAA